MSLTKSEDIMKSYPTTNNNIESFHAHFKHAVPRQHLPLFLAVRMAYHFAKNCEIHANGIQDGTRKPNRKRGGPGSCTNAESFLLPTGRTNGLKDGLRRTQKL